MSEPLFEPQIEMNWPEEPRIFHTFTKHCPLHGVMPCLKRTWDADRQRACFRIVCSFVGCEYVPEEWSESAALARRLWNLRIILAHDP